MKFRQAAPIACLALLVITPAACTMPERNGPSVRNSYPPIVQTETGGTPMLQDNSTGVENAMRGVKTKN